MDLTNIVLAAVVAVMLANQLIMRRGRVVSPAPFWGLQAALVVVAALVVLAPMPKFERFALVPWTLAALLAIHLIQNLSLRARWQDQARRDARIAEEEELLEKERSEEP